MFFEHPTKEQMDTVFTILKKNVETENTLQWVKYIDLGVKTIRLMNYSPEFTGHVQKQLAYVLKDEVSHFDTTIVIWREHNIKNIFHRIAQSIINPHRFRLEKVLAKKEFFDIIILDKDYSLHNPVFTLNIGNNIVEGYDKENNIYFYGVNDLNPEEFIKQGHIFVQMFNKIARTDTSHLVHGAAVGLNNEGILFCARGQRGKSTLAVLSMMQGFEYVSDDYLILEQEGKKLYSHPIYSIITLSPRMYSELYDKLEGTRFVSNNARKDKYVINIGKFEATFKSKYPIKFCMFPEIVDDLEPSIVPCPKGRAITQLIHSTVAQLQDMNNTEAIKKLFEMVKDFEFYQINLSQDIDKNTVCLRHFMENYDKREKKEFVESPIFEDITFNIATFFDSNEHVIYSMNILTTQIYELLKKGIDKNLIFEKLSKLEDVPNSFKATLEEKFSNFLNALEKNKIIVTFGKKIEAFEIKTDSFETWDYMLSFMKYTTEKAINLADKE